MSFGHFHPGVTFRGELEARGMTAASLALKLRVSPQRLHEIIRGNRAITPETALRLGLHFGNEPEFWMNLPIGFDLASADHKVVKPSRREGRRERATKARHILTDREPPARS